MKLNKEIISKEYNVYSEYKAKRLFKKGKYSARQLSLMKQENIRVALQSGKINTNKIQDDLTTCCGYCFKYCDNELEKPCETCPLFKRLKVECIDSKITQMWDVNYYGEEDRKDFSKEHKKWCKKIGLWKKGWK